MGQYDELAVSKILLILTHTAQKMKFSIKDFSSKSDQICNFRWLWSHLLKKSLKENFTFCAVSQQYTIQIWPHTSHWKQMLKLKAISELTKNPPTE